MKNQSGRSLFEMIVVIGIIGLLTVTGISGLGGGTASMRANSLQYDIEEVAKRIIEVNAWRRDGTFVNCTVYDKDSPNTVYHIDTKGLTYIPGLVCDGTTFTLTYSDIPEKVCHLVADKTFADLDCDCDNDTTVTCEYEE